MHIKTLKYSKFENDIFFVKDTNKIKGIYYGVVKLKLNEFKAIVETADLTTAAYPLPRNLRERLENNVLPRFYELKDVIDTTKFFFKEIRLEISQLNQEDILYGLQSFSISKMLIEKGFKPENLTKLIKSIQFLKY